MLPLLVLADAKPSSAPRFTGAGFVASLGALLVCVAHFASFDIASVPIHTDTRLYLYFSWQVTEGAVPHLDFFDNKTQLATFVGALFYKLGEYFQHDPLIWIRLGNLGLATLGGWLSFFVFRQLGKGSLAGFLGVLAYCSFGYLGALPALGPLPKLVMALCASTAAVLVGARRWFWAGTCGALAFMDWQIGVLVWLGVFVAAVVFATVRARATVLVIAGGVLGMTPFLLYYLVKGGLSAAFQETIIDCFFRGASSLESKSLDWRLDRIQLFIERACPGHEWLFFLSLLGVFVLLFLLVKWRRDPRGPAVLALAIYHFGVLGFSLLDFQGHGDFFLILHSLAFLLGLVWLAAYELLKKFALARALARRGPVGAAFIVLAGAGLVGRPSFLRPELTVISAQIEADVTLEDQRQVSLKIQDRTKEKSLVFLDASEQLFLMRRKNPLPIAYYNRAAWNHFRASESEEFMDTVGRLLLSINPDAFVFSKRPRTWPQTLKEYAVQSISSENGKYQVELKVR